MDHSMPDFLVILIHQRADRKSKNYNPMVSRKKTTITEN